MPQQELPQPTMRAAASSRLKHNAPLTARNVDWEQALYPFPRGGATVEFLLEKESEAAT